MRKRILSLLLVAIMLLSSFNMVLAADVTTTSAPADVSKVVEIVSFNDFHGNVKESGKNIGMAKMVAYAKQLAEENPNRIFVSGGDLYQGTAISNLSVGKPVSAMLKRMGIVASAVGNHEFDWGVDNFDVWAKDGGFDWLAANIIVKDTQEPVEWAKPYLIIEKGGIKVALIGLAHPDTSTLVKADEEVAKLEFADPVEAAKKWIEFLKAGKAEEGVPDVIIALTHIDSKQEKDGTITGKVEPLTHVEGLDGIISAHSHQTVYGKLNGMPIAQGYYNGRGLAILSIQLDKDNKVIGIEPRFDDLAAKVNDLVADEEALKDLEVFEEEAKPILGEVIGQAAEAFTHNSKEDNVTLLGRWSSEVMKNKTGVQIAIQNGGGLRRTLEKGNITMGDLYEIMPFDNQLVTLEMTGADIKKAIDHGIYNPEVGNGQFAGLIVEYDKTKEFENRITKISLEDGTPLEMDKYYTVVTNDFLITGGDKYDFSNARNVKDTFIPIRDVLVEAIKEAGTITPIPVDYLIEVSEKAPEPQPQPQPQPKEDIVYIVVSGDVLWKIAQKYGTTWQALAEYNKLANPHLIFVNQKIKIPAK